MAKSMLDGDTVLYHHDGGEVRALDGGVVGTADELVIMRSPDDGIFSVWVGGGMVWASGPTSDTGV